MNNFIKTSIISLFLLLSAIVTIAQDNGNKPKMLPKYRYCDRSTDTFRVLNIRGIGTKRLYFYITEKEGDADSKITLQGSAKMISDSEIEEDNANDNLATFSQEYWYEEGATLYSFRTDAETNSFIHFQTYTDGRAKNNPIINIYFRRCK